MKEQQKSSLKLYPQQLVIEAIEYMLEHNVYLLPVIYDDGFNISISFKELISFLTFKVYDEDHLLHKLMMDLETAIAILLKQK